MVPTLTEHKTTLIHQRTLYIDAYCRGRACAASVDSVPLSVYCLDRLGCRTARVTEVIRVEFLG